MSRPQEHLVKTIRQLRSKKMKLILMRHIDDRLTETFD